MKYTEKIQKAIKFATKTHDVYQKQKRKGKDISYITHPLTVGIILAIIGKNEDIISAGILHDTIEDSIEEKKVDYKMLEQRFGKKVARDVLSVTETEKRLSWAKRKEKALKHIEQFSHSSVLIKSADILANGRELIDDYHREGEAVFDRFNAGRNDVLANYQKVIAALLKRWKDNPLSKDLKKLAENLPK
ncbi:MAG TPA: HD domain-containing protein [Candidatus Moranbacteria bacterium]|nr:HD domain-containing protein [Candidatus Moranbacteria bacterium]HRZ33911.1 HD domain-containing protein [Candidatus Moranbacteria bacterium]